MTGRRPRRLPMENVLNILFEEDPEDPVSAADSSSEDEDLLYADNGDKYYIPLSESDDDYEPQQPSTSQTGPLPSTSTARPASAPLPQLSTSSESDSLEERQPKRKGKAMQKPASKRGRGGSARPRVREEEGVERWHDRQERDQKPDPPRFMPARIPGPTFDTTKSWSPLALFQLFFSTSVVRTIINNTNANAAKRQQAGKKFKWEVLTVKSFYTFLAVIVFSGLVTVHNRADYWRKKSPYNFAFPGDKMSRGRFEAILWSLHLSNPDEDEENDRRKNTGEYDRLFKIKPLYSEMVEACKAHYHPHQNIAINERTVASKARISMKQYMKDEPTKRGYKLFVLADSATAYTWNFFVCPGKSVSTTGQGLSYTAVMDLLPFPLLGGGYTVYTENFYTSPALFQDLAKKSIGCCVTIRKNRVGFPQTHTNDLPEKAVPDAVVDYNHNMGGVDYSVCHNTMKWYKTFFYHFLDIAVVNSFLLHKELFKLRNPTQTKPHSQKTFREQLLTEMLEFAEGSAATPPPSSTPTTCMPMYYASEDSRVRKHCKNCLDAGIQRVKTAIFCRKCQVPLCFTPKKNCFQLWHDKQSKERVCK